jgi:hemerythrin-like domain-containing protein
MRREIRNWDISVPSKHEFDFGNFAISYSKQVQYRNRITEMISVVYAHHEMIFQAHKNLKEMAIKLTSGAKHDKEATAAFTVHRFVVPMSHAKRFLTYLEHVLRNIDFAASQMDRMLREHQALSRINQTFNSEGMSQSYSRDTPTNSQYNKPSVKIKTRNSRID